MWLAIPHLHYQPIDNIMLWAFRLYIWVFRLTILSFPTDHFEFSDTSLSYVPKYATRPLKISFNNVNEKEIVMKALPKLKNSKLNVHVTHDHTIMDRKKISLWNLRAKTKNKEETGSFVWRVTGSPATTLRLTRFETKRDHTTVPTNNVQHNRALRRGLERPVKL